MEEFIEEIKLEIYKYMEQATQDEEDVDNFHDKLYYKGKIRCCEVIINIIEDLKDNLDQDI